MFKNVGLIEVKILIKMLGITIKQIEKKIKRC